MDGDGGGSRRMCNSRVGDKGVCEGMLEGDKREVRMDESVPNQQESVSDVVAEVSNWEAESIDHL